MDRLLLDNAVETWTTYRKIHPSSPLLPLLAAEHERNRIDLMYSKIKMNQWTDELLPEQIYEDFVTSVLRWRDMVTIEVLRNGPV
jgi:hypothetical protein